MPSDDGPPVNVETQVLPITLVGTGSYPPPTSTRERKGVERVLSRLCKRGEGSTTVFPTFTPVNGVPHIELLRGSSYVGGSQGQREGVRD